MADNYTPTTREVREYVTYGDWGTGEYPGEWFDNWLAAHDAEVQRKAAEEAYERGRLDERHDCNRYAEYQQGRISEEQYARDVRSRNPYRQKAGE